jgi:hypothetical protein
MAQRPKRGFSAAPAAALLVLILAFFSREALVRSLIEFHPPHSATASAAKLDKVLSARVDAALASADITDVSGAIEAALSVTDESLFFGLDHRTTLTFTVGEREGNCIEYAHLFALVFNQAAKRAGLRATASVIHSADARILGQKLPFRGFEDHDWVLIEDRSSPARRLLHVDPALNDAWLGWDISSIVRGPVK